jgi:hypothetical protein
LIFLSRFIFKIKLEQMDLPNPQTAAARLKKISPLRPALAIVLGSGFHHALKSPLQRGDCCIKLFP